VITNLTEQSDVCQRQSHSYDEMVRATHSSAMPSRCASCGKPLLAGQKTQAITELILARLAAPLPHPFELLHHSCARSLLRGIPPPQPTQSTRKVTPALRRSVGVRGCARWSAPVRNRKKRRRIAGMARAPLMAGTRTHTWKWCLTGSIPQVAHARSHHAPTSHAPAALPTSNRPASPPPPAVSVHVNKIGKNACRMMRRLPDYSTHRQELIYNLAPGVPHKEAAREFGVSPATVACYTTRSLTHPDLDRKYPHNNKRRKIPTEEEGEIINFIREMCPTKSGSPSTSYYLWTTKESLYHSYVQQTAHPRCYDTFMRIFNVQHINIRADYWGSFDCQICARAKHLDIGPSDRTDQKESDLIAQHKSLIGIQIEQYKADKRCVRTDEILGILDFTKVYLDVASENVVEVLVCVFMRRVDESIETEYIDFLCSDRETRANDYFFVRQALDSIFRQRQHIYTGDIQQLTLWTDGGPHHFKTNYHMDYLRTLASERGIQINHNFFPSYHGHSLADGHAGTLKSCAKKLNIWTEGERLKGFPCMKGPQSASELAGQLQTKMKNTKMVVFDKVDRQPRLKPAEKDLEKLDKIKSFHWMIFKPDGRALAYENSSRVNMYKPKVF
jgi:hypothetical protein